MTIKEVIELRYEIAKNTPKDGYQTANKVLDCLTELINFKINQEGK